jgi:hypothetical protein
MAMPWRPPWQPQALAQGVQILTSAPAPCEALVRRRKAGSWAAVLQVEGR